MFKKVFAAVSALVVYLIIFVLLLKNASIAVMSDNEYEISMPVVMYHSILKDPEKSGKYVVTPDTLDTDIKYLHANGYTTVSAAQVIDYVNGGEPLPEKPIMLTFDDGCYNNLFYAVPILKDNNARGIFSIVGAYTDEYTENNIVDPNYSYLRWEDVYEMYVCENCEIANHSYDFHKNTEKRHGTTKNKNETTEEYQQIFKADTNQLQEECYTHCGFYPIIYTYPYGSYSPESFDVLKNMGFKMSFSCEEGLNKITHNNECLYLLKRYNRPSGVESSEFFSQMK